jgi:hypothetical protein
LQTLPLILLLRRTKREARTNYAKLVEWMKRPSSSKNNNILLS